MFRSTLIMFASAITFVAAPAAFAQATPAETPVAIIVTITTPPGLTGQRLEAGFKQAIPVYEKIPGLIRKYFIANDKSFGGMYYWKNKAAADAWFTAAWREKAKATYGNEPELTYFNAPVQVDNAVK